MQTAEASAADLAFWCCCGKIVPIQELQQLQTSTGDMADLILAHLVAQLHLLLHDPFRFMASYT